MAAEEFVVRDERPKGYFVTDNSVIDYYASLIGPYPTLVYIALERHADRSTQESHPSLEGLAKKLGISRPTVKRAIAVLIRHKMITKKTRKTTYGDHDTNIYILLPLWVGSNRPEVGSNRPEGRVSQTRGVGSNRPPNKTQYEQDSLNKSTPSSTRVDEPPALPVDNSGKPPKVQELVECWEKICVAYGRLPSKRMLTDKLKTKIRARLNEHPDDDFWNVVLNKCVDSPLLSGKKTGWKATLDWLVANSENAIKVYEGHYDA